MPKKSGGLEKKWSLEWSITDSPFDFQALSDNFITEFENCFKIGQTVRAQVTEVDKEKGRFLISLRLSQCPPQSDESLLLLEDYMLETEKLCRRLGESSGKPGKLCALSRE